jgi:hypothetical protein
MVTQSRSNIFNRHRVNAHKNDSFIYGNFLLSRPSVDHTLGTSAGHYTYIESSFPQMPGHRAWLVSEVLESPMGACVDFWYHMKGDTTGNLTVLHRILDQEPMSLWSLDVRIHKNISFSKDEFIHGSIQGDQGDQWFNAKVDIPPTSNHYDFIFQGVVVC